MSLFSSAKFKATYAESRLSLMCNISAVELQQNVTGRCQEILQTLPPAPLPSGFRPRRAGQSQELEFYSLMI